MSGPFVLYKELSPTSNVHLSAFFTPSAILSSSGEYEGNEYLFVASISAVSIYRVHDDRVSQSSLSSKTATKGKGKFKGKSSTKEEEDLDYNPFLSLVYHSTLYGHTQDLQVFSPPITSNSNSSSSGKGTGIKQELLLLSLDRGKFCVLSYHPDEGELRANQMFNSQHDALSQFSILLFCFILCV